ncbi:MAG: hypothetical protein KDK66_03205, partial [Deltaproteobacteria bacterium]|nr:hypothetical protein [Deltaproteobacteria bacterium]
ITNELLYQLSYLGLTEAPFLSKAKQNFQPIITIKPMIKKHLIICLSLLLLSACPNSNHPPQEAQEKDNFSLKNFSLNPGLLPLKEGMELFVQQDLPSSFWPGKDYLILSISKKEPEGETKIDWQAYEAKSDNPEQAKSTYGGSLSLSDIHRGDHLSLSAFWPPAELYLSENTGIWFPLKELSQVLEKKSVSLKLGLDPQGFLGALADFPWTKLSLKAWKELQAKEHNSKHPINFNLSLLEKDKLCPLKVDGKTEEMPCALIGNDWIELKVLLSHENPLILSLKLVPKLSGADLAFHPLSLLKPWVDFEIISIESHDASRTSKSASS